MPKQFIRIDSQVLSTLGRCFRKANFQFLLNLSPMETKLAFERGSIVHAGFQTYYELLKEGKTWEEASKQGLADSLAFAMTTNVEHSEIDRLQEIIKGYFVYRRGESWIPLHVEAPFSRILFDSDELQILYEGRIDLVVESSQGFLAVDHKTVSIRVAQSELQNQFIGYCWATNSKTFVVNEIGLHKSKLRPDERYQRVIMNYHDDLIEEWRMSSIAIIQDWVRSMTNGEFRPNFSNCQGRFGACEYDKICLATADFREEVIKREFNEREVWDPFRRDYDKVKEKV